MVVETATTAVRYKIRWQRRRNTSKRTPATRRISASSPAAAAKSAGMATPPRCRSVHQPELHVVDDRAGKIAQHRKPCDPAHVPDELNLLDAHGGDSRG